MSPGSRVSAVAAAAGRPHSGHTAPDGPARGQGPKAAIRTPREETRMTWETPAATDFRFGFEITMYIAAR